MLDVVLMKQYIKDLKIARKDAKFKESELTKVVGLLQSKQMLPVKYKNHPLLHGWIGYFDCHIHHDIVLIYKLTHDAVWLARLGPHSRVF